MRKGRLRRVWRHMLGNMTKEAKLLIHLWRNILKMYLGNIIGTH
jgi:hypothetical protein